MASFLIIQTASIGDVILATALPEKLHEQFPDAHISLLVRQGIEALFEGHPYIHEVLVWDKSSHKYSNLLRLIYTIRRKQYDYLINLQRFAATGALTVLSGAKHTLGFDKNPLSFLFGKKVPHTIWPKSSLHETERNQKLIEGLTGPTPSKPAIYPTTADREKVHPLQGKPYICLAPASLWPTKQLPEKQWIELIQAIPGPITTYLLGGPADVALCQQIVTACAGQPVENLAGKLNLLQSAALMQGATMNYVNDSSPMHLASAMDAPVTAVFCSTLPEFGFGPLSSRKTTVQTIENLPCRPCGIHGHKACPLQHFRCATSIPVQSLLNPLNDAIAF